MQEIGRFEGRGQSNCRGRESLRLLPEAALSGPWWGSLQGLRRKIVQKRLLPFRSFGQRLALYLLSSTKVLAKIVLILPRFGNSSNVLLFSDCYFVILFNVIFNVRRVKSNRFFFLTKEAWKIYRWKHCQELVGEARTRGVRWTDQSGRSTFVLRYGKIKDLRSRFVHRIWIFRFLLNLVFFFFFRFIKINSTLPKLSLNLYRKAQRFNSILFRIFFNRIRFCYWKTTRNSGSQPTADRDTRRNIQLHNMERWSRDWKKGNNK